MKRTQRSSSPTGCVSSYLQLRRQQHIQSSNCICDSAMMTSSPSACYDGMSMFLVSSLLLSSFQDFARRRWDRSCEGKLTMVEAREPG